MRFNNFNWIGPLNSNGLAPLNFFISEEWELGSVVCLGCEGRVGLWFAALRRGVIRTKEKVLHNGMSAIAMQLSLIIKKKIKYSLFSCSSRPFFMYAEQAPRDEISNIDEPLISLLKKEIRNKRRSIQFNFKSSSKIKRRNNFCVSFY